MPAAKLLVTVFVTALVTSVVFWALAYPDPAQAGTKTASCVRFTGAEGAPAQATSDWMVRELALGHPNFVVIPAGDFTTLCAW